jgi:thymidylate synthase
MLFREENAYLDIARRIIDEGYRDSSRPGIGVSKTHAEHMSFDLSNGKVPIPSTRQLPNIMAPVIELEWFISGSTDVKFLKDNKVGIWDSWVIPETAVYDSELDLGLRELESRGLIKFGEDMKGANKRKEFILKYGDGLAYQLLEDLTGVKLPVRKLLSGSIGPGAYGAQWRNWEDFRTIPFNDEAAKAKLEALGYKDFTDDIFPGAILEDNPAIRVMRKEHDQLQAAVDRIKEKPDDRRIIVSAWNPGRLDQAVLPPCHSFFQFLPFEHNGVKKLDVALTCRSQDFLVGTVFNCYQYSVLAHVIAKLTGREANRMFWTGNNTHIYDNQKELFDEYHRERSPMKNTIQLVLPEMESLADFKASETKILGYDNFHEPIKYPIAV